MTKWKIAGAYFLVLVAFAGLYYAMPDSAFYHQSIQFEPSTIDHLRLFKEGLDKALDLQKYGTGPYGVSVSSVPVHDLSFPGSGTVRFLVGYYYYKMPVSEEEWPVLTARCGPSEKQQPFYLRTISYRMTTSASSGGASVTVHAETPTPSECDLGVLHMRYTSIEKTAEGFQAMVPVTSQLNGLIEAVPREQLGHAPRSFPFDRFIRMFYFSVAVMTTTGFGDILPLSTPARLSASLETLLGIVLAGLFLNAVAKG